MKKIAFLLLLSLGIKGQTTKQTVFNNSIKPFIGYTLDKMNKYWSDKVSESDIITLGEGPQQSFAIMEGGSGAGQGYFSADFKDGKCIENETPINFKQISIVEAKLKNQGYKYDQFKKAWFNKNIKAEITGPFGNNYAITFKTIEK